MKNLCIHVLISGEVQGVFFRDHTRRRAQALQITGWVRNLPDGRVETVACGTEKSVREFIEWLQKGSPKSKVSEVQWQETPPQTFADFSIR